MVPQYPAKLRYQEWWYWELPRQYMRYFDVVVLGQQTERVRAPEGQFSPVEEAVEFEMSQIREYFNLELRPNDVLLLCDISFPGLFGQVLFHKKPKRCFAICHATSRNRYDYFAGVRPAKWQVESGLARLFDKIFVATYYHRDKLGWKNAVVTGLPLPPPDLVRPPGGVSKSRLIVSVARTGRQKRSEFVERMVERRLGIKLERPDGCGSWAEYYQFLAESAVMLITAKEETFGYQVVDALMCGTIPVAPNAFSYPELLPRQYLYSNVEELLQILVKALGGQLPVPKLLVGDRCASFFERTAKLLMSGW